MPSTTTKNTFVAGIRTALPFAIVVTPFAMAFGAVAAEAGLNIAQVMGFTVLVIAGAAQFTALHLMLDQAPTIIVLLSALAVNLRMAMYAATLAPHIGAAPLWQRLMVAYGNFDATFAMSMANYEAEPDQSPPEKALFFLGTCAFLCPIWFVASYLGAILGAVIPAEIGLDFAVPILFISFVAPALRTFAHVAAAAASIILSLSFAWVPYNLWILVAGIGGMMVGAEVERRRAKP